MALVKRLVKGGPLTFAEGDGNLDYLEGLTTAVKSWDDIVSKPITSSNAIAVTGGAGISIHITIRINTAIDGRTTG